MTQHGTVPQLKSPKWMLDTCVCGKRKCKAAARCHTCFNDDREAAGRIGREESVRMARETEMRIAGWNGGH